MQISAKRPNVCDISTLSSVKMKLGYELKAGKRRYTINTNGRINHPELLFAVLKGLPILVMEKQNK